MKVLLLSYYYPPDRAVGGQRARKVAEALRASGHEVTVIAAGTPNLEAGCTTRIRPLPLIRELHAWLKGLHRSLRQESGSRAGSADQGPRDNTASVARWKRWIFSLIWLPDERQGYVLPAVWRAMRDPAGPPDLIYSTAPPFSVHLAGLLLKAVTGALWVAEFRDPWTTNPWKQEYLRSAFSDRAERYLEELCLEHSDLLVPVSEGIADRIRDRNTGTAIVTVRNGIERLVKETLPTGETRSDPFEIVYAGSFYHSRSPFPFLQAIEQLVKNGADDRVSIQVRFIGTTERFDGVSIAAFLQDRGLTDVVRLEGWMDRDRCLQHVLSADALLLLAMNQPDQVPNKLYEYLGTRRPILAVTDAAGETARMLRESGGHVIVTENEAVPIREGIKEILSSQVGSVGDLELLTEWTTKNQMARLVAAVGNLKGT